jgi:hypothetical protein
MKLGLVLVATLLAATSMGCAANPAMQAQVESLQRESARQDAEIKDLSAKAAKCNAGLVAGDLKQDASDLATAAWSWLSETTGDASKTGNAIIACYRAGSSDVHTFEQGQNLMSRCYTASQQK